MKHLVTVYRVEHQTLPVRFFCDSYGMLQDIDLKFCIETLQTYREDHEFMDDTFPSKIYIIKPKKDWKECIK